MCLSVWSDAVHCKHSDGGEHHCGRDWYHLGGHMCTCGSVHPAGRTTRAVAHMVVAKDSSGVRVYAYDKGTVAFPAAARAAFMAAFLADRARRSGEPCEVTCGPLV